VRELAQPGNDSRAHVQVDGRRVDGGRACSPACGDDLLHGALDLVVDLAQVVRPDSRQARWGVALEWRGRLGQPIEGCSGGGDVAGEGASGQDRGRPGVAAVAWEPVLCRLEADDPAARRRVANGARAIGPDAHNAEAGSRRDRSAAR
jgi:hypothetical protein